MAMQSNARTGAAAVSTWTIDPAQSRAEFTIRKRLLVLPLTVRGRLGDVHGTITLDDQEPANSRVEARIGAAPIVSGIAKRDKHLLTKEFFDVERFPALQFSSNRVEALDLEKGEGRISGKLTIRAVTRDVSLALSFPPAAEIRESTTFHLTATTELNRRDFGIVWNSPLIGIADVARIDLAIVAERTAPTVDGSVAPASA